MMSLEFEVPVKRLNNVMGVILREDSKLQWVYYREDTQSVVVRTTVSKNALQTFLLRLASAVDVPVEVTIVDERETGRAIHEAFLLRVDVSEGSYPVVILLLYNVSKFYPDTIIVGTSADAPQELVDTVLKLTIGKVNLLETEKVRSSIVDGGLFIQLRANVPSTSDKEIVLV
ncbi:hypothetical protein [Thermococcus sp. 9N3]|uniref:hypothetical protein n=1 Tax=Thermococcus sp. 9N3 TaxID=163002 RepID=UPI00142F4BD5|nr:hypothetical protein [Thermococcus sp. 9N3]NJE48607.1 hypothetical protein [Thermococcus sp. 9N3]